MDAASTAIMANRLNTYMCLCLDFLLANTITFSFFFLFFKEGPGLKKKKKSARVGRQLMSDL